MFKSLSIDENLWLTFDTVWVFAEFTALALRGPENDVTHGVDGGDGKSVIPLHDRAKKEITVSMNDTTQHLIKETHFLGIFDFSVIPKFFPHGSLDLNMSLWLGSSRHISNISYLNYITSLMISNL